MLFGTQVKKTDALRILDSAFELGICFFDTAELYPVPSTSEKIGYTEEILGEWLRSKKRESVILSTKFAGPGHGWYRSPVRGGLAALDRVSIKSAIDGSLRRLGTEYVDLYQSHWPDPSAEVYETLQALDELKREGKIRVIGSSNESSWGAMNSLSASKFSGLARIEFVQNNYSFNNRRVEDELAEVLTREQLSLLAYAPLAGGVMSGKYSSADPQARYMRDQASASPRRKSIGERYVNPMSVESARRFCEIAKKHLLSPITLAIAWVLRFDFVSSAIVGCSDPGQLQQICASTDHSLSCQLLEALDQVSSEIKYPMG